MWAISDMRDSRIQMQMEQNNNQNIQNTEIRTEQHNIITMDCEKAHKAQGNTWHTLSVNEPTRHLKKSI